MRTTLLPAAILLAVLPAAVAQARPAGDGTDREVHLYDVRDLAERVLASRPEAGNATAEPRGAAQKEATAALARMVRRCVTPTLEPEEDVQAVGLGHLSAVTRPEQHVWITGFLAAQRAHTGTWIDMRARVLEIDAGVDRAGLGDAPVVLEAEEWAKLERRLRAPDGAWIAGVSEVLTPRVMMLPLQPTSVATGEQVSWIGGFDLQRIDGAEIADPTGLGISTAWDGVRIEAEGAFLPGDGLALHTKVAISSVERPIPTRETTLGSSGTKVEVQAPKVHSVELEATLRLAPGATAVFPAPPGDGVRTVVLVTAVAVDPVPPGAGR